MEKVLRVEDGKYVAGEVIGAEAKIMELLWENPDPTVSYASGSTISIEDDSYEYFEIVHKYAVDMEAKDTNVFYQNDTALKTTCAWGDQNGFAFSVRTYTISKSGNTITLTAGATYVGKTAASTPVTSNVYGIPVAIYGIKKVVDVMAKDVATTADKCMLSDGVTSVESDLTKLNCGRGSVTVTKSGTDTYRTMLTSLNNLIDYSKINPASRLKIGLRVFYVAIMDAGASQNLIYFTNTVIDTARYLTYQFAIGGDVLALQLYNSAQTNLLDTESQGDITLYY